jgi:hypothetical protein
MSITNVPFFSPRSITGCSLWLDGADTSSSSFTYSSGSNISVWKDKSSSANNFSLTSGTTSSINDGGNIVVNFPYGAVMTSTSQIAHTASSAFFLVSKVTNSSGFSYVLGFTNLVSGDHGIKFNNGILTGTPGSDQYNREFGTSNFYVNGSFDPNFGSNYYTNVYSIIDIVSPQTLVHYPSQTGPSFLTLSSSFYGRYFVGRIAEFIYYAGGVTSTQRTTIEAYLAQKWGITGRLSTGHPGYTTFLYRPPTFSPTQLPGCAVWLDGGDSNTISFSSGSNVSTWIDKSGNGRSATVYAGTPTYTSALGMTFNGSSSLQITYTASPTIESMFVIIKFNSVSGQGDILSGTAAGQREYLMYIPYSPGTIYLGRHSTGPSGAINGGTVTTGSNYLLGYIFNGTGNTISFFQSGNAITSGTPQFTYSAGGTISVIGSYNGGGYLQGQIYEMIIYSTALSTTDRQQVEAYLAKKWALASGISSDHLGATSVAFKNSSSLLTPIPFTAITYAFAPTQIAGCSLWLDGADPAGNGVTPATNASITTWADKSGLGNTATNQGSAGSVTFTAAGLVFNGSGYFYMPGLAGNLVNTAFVIFMVETLNTTGGTMLIGDDAQTNYNTNNVLHIMYRTSTNHTFAFYANDLENYSVSGTGIRRLWTFWLPTASNRVTRRNGAVDVTHGNYSRLNYWSTPAIGRGFGGYNYIGTMSEVIIYPSDIGINNILKVEAYLAQKWGSKSSLGAGHVGLTTDYFNSQSILRRATLTAPVRLAKVAF